MRNKYIPPEVGQELAKYIDTNNTIRATDLLKVLSGYNIQTHPELLDAELHLVPKFTPLGRAAFSSNYSMCRVLLGMGADPDRLANDQSPLMIASHRNNVQIVELLVEYKANTRATNSHRLTALDFAILHGNYTIALFFVKEHRMMVVRSLPELLTLAKSHNVTYYVNYEQLLECLSKQLDDFSIPNFFEEPQKSNRLSNINSENPLVDSKNEMYDPVLDPNEGLVEMIKRWAKCEPAPLVERNTLPPPLQPQNRLLGKLHYYVDKFKPKNPHRGKLSLLPKTSDASFGDTHATKDLS